MSALLPGDATTTRPGSSVSPEVPAAMTHQQVMQALSGLLLGLFVAVLSSTVVANALPVMTADLGGGQSAYTWIVTSTLLATCVSTPIWGKLADLLNRKTLVQSALGVFILGSVLAGIAPNIGVLLGARVLQGLGAGGLISLAQVILASMVSPRARGRYTGYLGAVVALAYVTGPLIGGAVVSTSWLGWRWCFALGIPFALAALVVLQRTLRITHQTRRVHIDVAGALTISLGVSALLIWVSLAGHEFGWFSATSGILVLIGVALLALALAIESRSLEPMIPLHLFSNRTLVLAVAASAGVGIGVFSATTFLSQYFQLARGQSPVMAGLMTIPMIAGQLVASVGVGRLVSRYGKWKRYLVMGTVCMIIGFTILATAGADSPYALVSMGMVLVGLGIGSTLQNLVLAVQNSIAPQHLGAGSSTVVFFRTLGGAIGVSILGAVLSSQVSSALGSGSGEAKIPDLASLSDASREAVTGAYGQGIALVFALCIPFAVLALVAIMRIREVPLRLTSAEQQLAAQQ